MTSNHKVAGSSPAVGDARLAQSVERQPFKLVVVGSSPTSGEGRRLTLGLDPEVSCREMEKHNPFVKWCFTILSE